MSWPKTVYKIDCLLAIAALVCMIARAAFEVLSNSPIEYCSKRHRDQEL